MSVWGYIKDVFARPAVYRKFWVALAGAVLTVLSMAIDSPYFTAILPFLTAGGVISVSNKRS